APIDGAILKVNVRLGEYAQAGVLSDPLMTMGSVDPLHVRVDIDETETWRIRPGHAALARLRGNPEISAPLTFVRFEPYVLAKRSLTGDTTERVDTRVLQDRRPCRLKAGSSICAPQCGRAHRRQPAALAREGWLPALRPQSPRTRSGTWSMGSSFDHRG